jgi:hypothetical protein
MTTYTTAHDSPAMGDDVLVTLDQKHRQAALAQELPTDPFLAKMSNQTQLMFWHKVIKDGEPLLLPPMYKLQKIKVKPSSKQSTQLTWKEGDVVKFTHNDSYYVAVRDKKDWIVASTDGNWFVSDDFINNHLITKLIPENSGEKDQ